MELCVQCSPLTHLNNSESWGQDTDFPWDLTSKWNPNLSAFFLATSYDQTDHMTWSCDKNILCTEQQISHESSTLRLYLRSFMAMHLYNLFLWSVWGLQQTDTPIFDRQLCLGCHAHNSTWKISYNIHYYK